MQSSFEIAVRRTAMVAACLASMTIAGCGGGMCPVDGQVVWQDGKPATELSGSQIYFEHADGDSNAIGEIGPDATFHLMTNEPNDGALPGKHKIYIVEKLANADASGSRALPGILDHKYYNSDTSGLTQELVSGVNQVTVKLDRAAKSE
jgi:hypothetical protein